MKNQFSISICRAAARGFLLSALAACTTLAKPEAPNAGQREEAHPEFLLVGFRPESAREARERAHREIGARRERAFERISVDVVRLERRADRERVMAAYRARPEIAFVEPNYRLRAMNAPNDPRFGELWGLRNTGQNGGTPGADISALEAWTTTTGSPQVIVAVIDSGIDYNHPDIAPNMWVNPSPTFGDLHGARWTGGNGNPTSGNPMDGDGHGTHVAGTIGAVGNNGLGVAGVAWQVRLMALKFLDDRGSGWTADAIAALEYAVDHGAHLSNNSWGGGGFSQALKIAIEEAAAANQLFVVAAGNSGTDNDVSAQYPSNYDCANILSVANSDRNDARASSSCFGRFSVDLAAPGTSILSTVPGSAYGLKSGTSMAAPHVSGAAALLLARHPGASHAELKAWLMQGATKRAAWRRLTVSEARLNAAEALRLAALPAAIAPVTNLEAEGQDGQPRLSLSWTNPSGAGFLRVNVRRGTQDFPSSPHEGQSVYLGADNAFIDEPLLLGQIAYYSVWAEYADGSRSAVAYAATRVGGAPDDWFTEFFNTTNNDLAYHTVTFLPDSSPNGYRAYSGAASVFPTDPAGGAMLALGDDAFAAVTPSGGQKVRLFGQEYGKFYVGSNGYITFDEGDTAYAPSLNAHFSRPRVSGLFVDLNPAAGGSVSWRQLADRVAVTYQNVPLWRPLFLVHSFQIELFFDGRIRLTWLNIGTLGGLAGLSRGDGTSVEFMPSNLTAYSPFEALQVTPASGFTSEGHAGGPFDPHGTSYRLFNAGDAALNWTAATDADWVSTTPADGSLAPGAFVDVALELNSAADSLAPGDYPAHLVFGADAAGSTHTRMIELSVLPPVGGIRVTDSLAPEDDLAIPFGPVLENHVRSEQITIGNIDPSQSRTIEVIALQAAPEGEAEASSTAFFALEGLPVLPLVLASGSDVTFDVIYAPTESGTHAAIVSIQSNDAVTPDVWVQLTGEGVPELMGRTITVTASPEEGGTVGGGGFYAPGAMATVTAAAAEGFVFEEWTEGDAKVATFAVYTFTVTDNRDLVAHFREIPPPAYIYFQHADGLVARWMVDSTGSFIEAQIMPNTAPWRLMATGDVDGDGLVDLLWQTPPPDRLTGGWFMDADGSARDARYWWPTGPWEMRAAADYDGDGRANIFWQTDDGHAAVWTLEPDGQFRSSLYLGQHVGWRLAAAGDLDGDGQADIFWQDEAGQVRVQYADGDGTRHFLAEAGPWRLIAAADLDADGITDLLWQTPEGLVGGWFMNADGAPRDARFWWATGQWKLRGAGR